MSDLAGADFRGVFHFSFTVSDLDRSVAFYRDLLGLELVHTQEQDNAYTRRLVGFPGAVLRVAQLAVPGQPRGISTHDLELVEYVRPEGVRREGRINDPGAAHLAFTITDAWAAYGRLTGAAVRFVSPPNAITGGVNVGGYACYFYEIVLELLQPPAHRLAGA